MAHGLVTLKKGDDRLQVHPPGVTGWGGNSGFHAFNLAVQMFPRRVILIGYDMSVARGVHWHGEHDGGLSNPTAERIGHWRQVMDAAAETVRQLEVDVVNCSEVSALTAYPKMRLEEALAC